MPIINFLEKSPIQHELTFINMKFINCIPNGNINSSMSELMII